MVRGWFPRGTPEIMIRHRKGHTMFRQRYSPKAVVRPGKGIAEHDAELKKKLYAVKVTLGDCVLAEGIVELPADDEEKHNPGKN